MRSLPRVPAAVAGALAGALGTALLVAPAASVSAADPEGPAPALTGLALTHPAIHAVGVEGTGVPKKTRLELTLNVAALVRVRVKDTDPYGLSRAFNSDLPAGASAVTFSARVDGTKLPPGKYDVVVKAHNSSGSSPKMYLRLRIVGNK
jgi:hypothetical protein